MSYCGHTVHHTNYSACIVGSDVSSDLTLLEYLRNRLGLYGTKYMCREGGCGACTVAVHHQPSGTPYAINSITTIEGLGNRLKGYHELQKTLADENGSQCGYCSPGWVMAMYGILKGNPNITMLEVEKSLGSNVCRCTGYRPILDAFKKYAKDAPRQIKLQDIEDLQICPKTGQNCDKSDCEDHDWCFVGQEDMQEQIIEIKLKDNRLWFRVQEVKDIFKILQKEGDDSYMLVNGNTAKGVYPIDEYPRVLIDISGVQELKGYTIDQNLIVNAGTTLTEFLEILKTVAKKEFFGYLNQLYEHVLKVAHIPIRNMMPRSQNASALINAGFMYRLNKDNTVKSAKIVFGALSPTFYRAKATEQFLVGKQLFINETLSSALKILNNELIVEDNPPAPSVEYRKKVALGLFYKQLLHFG
nr:uncharacterized protein LOC110380995 [Helicoverpa armigera]